VRSLQYSIYKRLCRLTFLQKRIQEFLLGHDQIYYSRFFPQNFPTLNYANLHSIERKTHRH